MEISKYNNNSDINSLKYLWKYIKPYKLKLTLLILLLIFNKVILVLVPLSVKSSIDIIQGNNIEIKLNNWQFFTLKNIKIIHISLFILFLLTLHLIGNWIQVILSTNFAQNIAKDIREKLFSHVLKQSITFFDKSKTGSILTNIVNDIEALNQLLSNGLRIILGDILLVTLILIVSFILDFRLAIICISILIILFILIKLFNNKIRDSFLDIRKITARINSLLQSVLNGIKVILIFNQKNKIMRKFRKNAKSYLKVYIKTIIIHSRYFSTLDFLTVIPQLIFIGFGSYLIYTNQIPLSTIITFMLFTPIFFAPLKQISDQINGVQTSIAATKRIINLLSKKDSLEKENTKKETKRKIKGEIEFKNVCFSYNENKKLFNNLNLKIKEKEIVALVGETGSGKTTIVNLLNKFYKIHSGEILIDKININNYPLKDLRKSISYVMQDFHLFSGSISDNIKLFDKSISKEKILNATKKIESNNFINKISKKYDHILGEKGKGISFGERQLVSFARALVQNSPILILDEATSNIDLKTEKIIQKKIKTIIKNRTTIIIAHRLSTIKNANKIIVLNKGKIKEIGNHKSLLKKKGFYYRLYKNYYKK